jgi:hypothetical protein
VSQVHLWLVLDLLPCMITYNKGMHLTLHRFETPTVQPQSSNMNRVTAFRFVSLCIAHDSSPKRNPKEKMHMPAVARESRVVVVPFPFLSAPAVIKCNLEYHISS